MNKYLNICATVIIHGQGFSSSFPFIIAAPNPWFFQELNSKRHSATYNLMNIPKSRERKVLGVAAHQLDSHVPNTFPFGDAQVDLHKPHLCWLTKILLQFSWQDPTYSTYPSHLSCNHKLRISNNPKPQHEFKVKEDQKNRHRHIKFNTQAFITH